MLEKGGVLSESLDLLALLHDCEAEEGGLLLDLVTFLLDLASDL